MIKRHGIIEAGKSSKSKRRYSGYTALLEMGFESYAFEAVILRHPSFSSRSSTFTV
jgi:hypothetical protein